MDPAVPDTLCRVILNAAGTALAPEGVGVGDSAARGGGGEPRPWRVGRLGSIDGGGGGGYVRNANMPPAVVSYNAQTPLVVSGAREWYAGDWGPQELSVTMSALAKLIEGAEARSSV